MVTNEQRIVPKYYEAIQDLKYDPSTGAFFNLTNDNKLYHRGWIVWYRCAGGHTVVFWRGKKYYARSLIWLLQTGKWPDGEVQHINGDRSDFRWGNLRDTPLPPGRKVRRL